MYFAVVLERGAQVMDTRGGEEVRTWISYLFVYGIYYGALLFYLQMDATSVEAAYSTWNG